MDDAGFRSLADARADAMRMLSNGFQPLPYDPRFDHAGERELSIQITDLDPDNFTCVMCWGPFGGQPVDLYFPNDRPSPLDFDVSGGGPVRVTVRLPGGENWFIDDHGRQGVMAGSDGAAANLCNLALSADHKEATFYVRGDNGLKGKHRPYNLAVRILAPPRANGTPLFSDMFYDPKIRNNGIECQPGDADAECIE